MKVIKKIIGITLILFASLCFIGHLRMINSLFFEYGKSFDFNRITNWGEIVIKAGLFYATIYLAFRLGIRLVKQKKIQEDAIEDIGL
ncbi:hypothetical protein ACFFLS_22100 [Flavobacterium procerum]|uniref:Uncharacterized protein n=1 Tax=Flavobacterium procerum TaxID=1455569 RepID=A0ABV6BWE0_9FLAO